MGAADMEPSVPATGAGVLEERATRAAARRLPDDPRGVLARPAGGRLVLDRFAPGPGLAASVVWIWVAAWDLRDAPPHRQATLPHPSAHVVVADGSVLVHGPARIRFERVLEGRGRAVGVRLRPGALAPGMARDLVDRAAPAAAVLGCDAAAVVGAVEAASDAGAAAAAMERALAPHLPRVLRPSAEAAESALALLRDDPSIVRVSELARRVALGVRTLQRLFAEEVGLGPAEVIRRQRLQEAAAHALAGEPVDWARLAARLGFHDQAHLVRTFTAAVGTSPARYAARAGGMPQ